MKSLNSNHATARSISTILAVILSAISAGITVGIHSVYKTEEPRKASSDTYATRVIEAREGLSKGLLVYTRLHNAKVGDSLTFEATLYGTRTRKPVAPHGEKETSTPAGAVMGAKLHCTGEGITCISNSTEKKPVLRAQDDAAWSWTIRAQKSGKAIINLTITAYLDDTSTVIAEPIPVHQEIEIHDERNAFWGYVESAWKEILALLTAVGGAAGLLALWQQRRASRGSNGGDPSTRAPQLTSPPTEPPESDPGNRPSDAAAPSPPQEGT
ncbi:hypothetical protein [Streptomyces sp. CPS1]